MVTREIKLLSHQYKFVLSEAYKTILIAGRGSGKSFCSLVSAINNCLIGSNVIFICPTYGLIKKSVSTEIINLLNEFGLRYKYNKNHLLHAFHDHKPA